MTITKINPAAAHNASGKTEGARSAFPWSRRLTAEFLAEPAPRQKCAQNSRAKYFAHEFNCPALTEPKSSEIKHLIAS